MNNTNADFQIFLFYDINDTYFYTLTFSMKKFKRKKKKTLFFGFPRMILKQSAIAVTQIAYFDQMSQCVYLIRKKQQQGATVEKANLL